MATRGAKGADAIAAMEKERNAARAKEAGGWLKPKRWWQPYDTAKIAVFVDDEGYGVYEHRPYYDHARKDHEFTCVGNGEDCCEEMGRPGLVVFYSVVDCEPWRDSDGNEMNFFMKLFPAKFGVYDKITVKRAENGGLAGKKVKCRRYKTKLEPAVGSEHNVVGEVEDPNAFFKLVRYRGKFLTELFNKAEEDAEKLVELDSLFELQYQKQEDAEARQLVTDIRSLLSAAHHDASALATLKERFTKNALQWKGHLLLRRVPAFNYESILAAPSPDELDAIISKVRSWKRKHKDDEDGESTPKPMTARGGGGGEGKVIDDDLPF